MRGLKLASLTALLAGAALLAYAAVEGSLRVGLFLIIPFVYGTGGAAALGMLLLMAAGVLWFVGAFREAAGAAAHAPPDAGPPPLEPTPERRTERRHGGVILLGPIPIVWGSDRRVLPWMIAAGAALLVLALAVGWALR